MYGIWNTVRKEFQFGIKAKTAQDAIKQLKDKIGFDSFKWRFEVRKLPNVNSNPGGK